MTLIWKPWYTTGEPTLDEQHREIFGLINELGALVEAGRYDCAAVDDLLEQVGVHVDAHFALEEGCMAKHACPMAQKNKTEHEQLLEIYNGFVRTFGQKKSLAGLKKFHQSASDWILEHICFVDIHLRPCIRHGPPG